MAGDLEVLTERFALRVPARVDCIRRALGTARVAGDAAPGVAGPAAQTALGEARREAHKLAGTAGAYGFDDLGERARLLELLLTADDFSWTAIDGAMANLVDAATAVSPRSRASAHARRPRRLSVPSVVLFDARDGAESEYGMLLTNQLLELNVRTDATDLEAAIDGVDLAIVDDSTGSADDPFALVRRVRASEQGTSKPLAVVSRRTDLESRVAASSLGADLYLTHPLSQSSLTDAVSNLWAAARAERPKVLVVDDDEDALAATRAILTHDGIEVDTLDDPAKLLETLETAAPDALLLDLDMPKFDGVDLCLAVRASREYKRLPILFVTRRTDPESRHRAYLAGCDDYFLKPVVPVELCARVRARAERAVAVAAATSNDNLTGLPLRRTFVASLEGRLSEAQRRGGRLALSILDLDYFKRINDEYGHMAGDRVLAEFGVFLRARFRREDLRCRWGGEEFALAFPGESAETMLAVLERTLAELMRCEFTSDDGQPFSVSFSAGVSQFPEDGEALDQLLRVADQRLYQAKRAGRSRVVALHGDTGRDN